MGENPITTNDRAIAGIVKITLYLITVGAAATVACAVLKTPVPDFGVKEVALSLGGGLVGFLTGMNYANAQTKRPDSPVVQTKE